MSRPKKQFCPNGHDKNIVGVVDNNKCRVCKLKYMTNYNNQHPKPKQVTQFCPKGHDTFIVGRNSYHKCNECAKSILMCPITNRAVTYAFSKLKCKCDTCLQYRRDKDNTPERRAKRREGTFWRHLEARYGVSKAQYLRLLKKQNNRCALCELPLDPNSRKTKLCVDHDHETGKVRGLLCDNCNKGLGHFKDSPMLLKKAANYVIESRYK